MLREETQSTPSVDHPSLRSVEGRLIWFESNGSVPNHPEWPLIVYEDCWTGDTGEIENVYRSNNWGGTWRNGIYSYHHYHSNAHEVLGVVNGSAVVLFGGPAPGGVALELSAGDVAVLPAGTGHKRESSGGRLLVVGGYPKSCPGWNLKKARSDPPSQIMSDIRDTSSPSGDPIYGDAGPLVDTWQ
ncbi:MAG: cupin domain-containing protein [bacterium]